MPRKVGPVRPRKKDEKQYGRDIKRTVVDPIFQDLRRGLAEAASVNDVYRELDGVVNLANTRGVPEPLVRQNIERLRDYHRARLIQTFSSALAVDITPLLTNPAVYQFIEAKIRENVALIRTIPERFHASLVGRLQTDFRVEAFNQERLASVLRSEYGSTGYNVTRITRDQTTKTIGNLTEIRQRQVGIRGYRWSTSKDERVRPTHVANSGRFFAWDQPPAETGPPGYDVLCRCVAIPAVTRADRERLQSMLRVAA